VINVMLVILGALIPHSLLTEILTLIYTGRIIQLIKSSSHNFKFDMVIKNANNSNLEGYP